MFVHRVRLKHNKNIFLIFVAMMLFSIAIHSAWAANTSGGGLPSDAWFTKLIQSVTGPWAITFAIVGIFGAGATLIFGGDINSFLRTIVFLILVLSLVISAQNLLTALTGQGAEVAEAIPLKINSLEVYQV